jgi:molecular chaperone GrpE
MSDEMHEEPTTTAGDEPGPDTTSGDSLGALRTERDALQDRLLRTAAEFDNYRKRIDRERREQADVAATAVLGELLPVVDDLERALLAPATGDADAYRAGVELIHRQMLDVLRRRGVTPMDVPLGAPFDPRVHQAVTQEISADYEEGQIIAELRRGYMLGDRLLRPAMVKVAAA